ncbi:hypothetical protein SAMN05443633_105110 [Chryseobacterium arachidis]|uniref:Uncharacterized protein n=1 Tax=Chryseobacterium arachidis TaxID=1416778 RepID=A0A1M5D0R9_9FLAO|nr:hypothetical protein SAMN05443633_105110 [Chryseobacterium arachidis]
MYIRDNHISSVSTKYRFFESFFNRVPVWNVRGASSRLINIYCLMKSVLHFNLFFVASSRFLKKIVSRSL